MKQWKVVKVAYRLASVIWDVMEIELQKLADEGYEIYQIGSAEPCPLPSGGQGMFIAIVAFKDGHRKIPRAVDEKQGG